MIFDWDAATVTVTVPVHHTATSAKQEIALTLRQFAGVLLANMPEGWLKGEPVSDDLPLAVLDGMTAIMTERAALAKRLFVKRPHDMGDNESPDSLDDVRGGQR